MAAVNFRIGAMTVALHTGATGAGVSLSYAGKVLQRLHGTLAARARSRRDTQWTRPPTAAVADGAQAAALRARIADVGWYHTIDLGHGVRTPGEFDHLRDLHRYRLPETLTGRRVLDVGSFDGFWAFEFERRGAREVVALDLETFAQLDLPPAARAAMPADTLDQPLGRGFAVAREILGSRVERRTGTVYTLSPEAWGMFDLTHIGNVLVHLRDPALALQNIARVTDGTVIVSETVDRNLDSDPNGRAMQYMGGQVNCNWWRFSEGALVAMVADAGFADVRVVARFAIPHRGSARDMRQVVITGRRAAELRPGSPS